MKQRTGKDGASGNPERNHAISPTDRRDSDADLTDPTERLDRTVGRLEKAMADSHLRDIAYHFTNKKQVILVNLIAGIARGIGLTLGTSVVLGLLVFILSQIVTWPLIGEYISI